VRSSNESGAKTPRTKGASRELRTRDIGFAKLLECERVLASLSRVLGIGCEFNRFMSVLGIGVDFVECVRIQRSVDRFGDRFLHRVFTDGEIEYSMSMKYPARHLAARFAGKEAVSKAFGTGIGKSMSWRNIDIRKKESGEPFLVFSGPAEELAAKRGVTSALITLSHTEHHAMASVVLEGATSQPD
jgi:holo-[acyl-carrier protein] synthase